MMNLLKLAKLLPALKEGLKLSKALQSRTTSEQWKSTAVIGVVICVVIAVIKTQVATLGVDIPEEVWLGVATAALAALAPLLSRISAFANMPSLKLGEDATKDVIRVKAREANVWKNYCGTMGQALSDGYDIAVDTGGSVYDLKKYEYTGTTIKLSTAEMERFEKAMEAKLAEGV